MHPLQSPQVKKLGEYLQICAARELARQPPSGGQDHEILRSIMVDIFKD